MFLAWIKTAKPFRNCWRVLSQKHPLVTQNYPSKSDRRGTQICFSHRMSLNLLSKSLLPAGTQDGYAETSTLKIVLVLTLAFLVTKVICIQKFTVCFNHSKPVLHWVKPLQICMKQTCIALSLTLTEVKWKKFLYLQNTKIWRFFWKKFSSKKCLKNILCY